MGNRHETPKLKPLTVRPPREDLHTSSLTAYNSSEYTYQYANRNCQYRDEPCEFSPKECERLKELLSISTSKTAVPSLTSFEKRLQSLSSWEGPLKLVLDTDIGTDVDDVLALLMLLNMDTKQVQLMGVTTNYHPTLCRAKVARFILDAAGRHEVPVVAGSSLLCGSHRGHFLKGNEGQGLGLTEEELAQLEEIHHSSEAEDFIYSTVAKYPGEVVICAIGMMTNLGKVCHHHPDFSELVAHVVLMGGGSILTTNFKNFGTYCGDNVSKWGPDGRGSISEDNPHPFQLPSREELNKWLLSGDIASHPLLLFPNHNTSGDVLATKFLFDQYHCPISVVPHYITAQFWLQGKSIETLLEATRSLPESESEYSFPTEFKLCGKLLFEWLSRRLNQRGQCPHDPLTLYEAIFGHVLPPSDGFEFGYSTLNYVNGTFLSTEWAAFMVFVPHPDGFHRLAVSPRDKEQWLQWLESNLLSKVEECLVVEKSCVVTMF